MKSNRRRKQTARSEEGGLSRREFARGATVAAAAIATIPGGVLNTAAIAASHGVSAAELPQQTAGEKPKLSAEAVAEAEAKVSEILRRYGDKLDESQKADIRRLVRETQAGLEALRAFPLENSDEPATVLHLVGGAIPVRRSAASPAPAKPAAKPGA
ncbi:MAG TPA: hypothetical protein VEG63_11955 [Candidatus Acidoferrales bacterium]|nr:hypothetical protein [Candidatus Acidoferrales bacterium]